MKLTEEQRNHVIQKISQLWQGEKKCPLCNNEKWNVSDKIFELREINLDKKENVDISPVVTMTCANCGNMIMLNAMSLGFSFQKKETSGSA